MQTSSKVHTYTNPRPGQYLRHAHSRITRAVTATDSCFVLTGAHQRGKAVGLMNGENRVSNTPCCRGGCKAVYQAPASHNTCGSCWLWTAQQFYHDIRREGGSRVTRKLRQGAHIHQPTASPLPHACAQPYHTGSGSHGALFRPYWGSSAWHSRRSVTGERPFPAEARPLSASSTQHMWQLLAAWELYGSSPTTCAGKADHGFGVCVPLA